MQHICCLRCPLLVFIDDIHRALVVGGVSCARSKPVFLLLFSQPHPIHTASLPHYWIPESMMVVSAHGTLAIMQM